MKNMTRFILFLFAIFTASAVYGQQPPRGVAGVDVFLKQNPSKRVTTNASGTFAFDGLPAGSYTLSFRAKKAQDTKIKSTTQVTVATSYSIKIEGAKRVVKTGLTSDNLIGGFELRVDGAGSKIRGQVMADALKKMVWVPAEPGSHIPGRWVPADSAEAARRSNTQTLSREELADTMHRGNPNMTDPGGALDPARRPEGPDGPGR
jgi:Carboxypeptidase regulatory-like domain